MWVESKSICNLPVSYLLRALILSNFYSKINFLKDLNKLYVFTFVNLYGKITSTLIFFEFVYLSVCVRYSL